MAKRIAITSILIISILTACPTYALKFGYVDFGRIFATYQETQKAQAYLNEQDQKFIQAYKEAQKRVKITKDIQEREAKE